MAKRLITDHLSASRHSTNTQFRVADGLGESVAGLAAAANSDLAAWSETVGDWLNELAFEDMTCEEAIALQRKIYALLHVEPALWETCGRAEAALSAFVKSFPDVAREKNSPTEQDTD